MPKVAPPILELWLTRYVRTVVLPALGRTDVEVTNKEPAEGEFPAALIVIRDDSGTSESIITSERSVGVSVLEGTRLHDMPALTLAGSVFAWLTDRELPIEAGPDCPIAAVRETNGPYSVPEAQDRTRIYFTTSYVVVGSPVG